MPGTVWTYRGHGFLGGTGLGTTSTAWLCMEGRCSEFSNCTNTVCRYQRIQQGFFISASAVLVTSDAMT